MSGLIAVPVLFFLHDANGNRLDKNGNVIGRDAAFYPVTNSTNPYTRKPMGAWLR